MKKLFLPGSNPLEAVSNTAYQWQITRIVTGRIFQFEADLLPEELSEKLKILKLNIVVQSDQAAIDFTTQALASANTVQLQISEWLESDGSFRGDILVDGQSLKQLLIDNNIATL